jgi:hypothetical protein
MERSREQYIVPVGFGGIPGRVVRSLVFIATGGFLYPNVCIEGLDCTKIQDVHQGDLYDKI